MIDTLRLTDLRAYAALDARFGPGPQLVWGPNAAGKTSLLEAMVLLAAGASVTGTAHRCGWATTSGFIDTFRRTTGRAPGAYFPRSSLR